LKIITYFVVYYDLCCIVSCNFSKKQLRTFVCIFIVKQTFVLVKRISKLFRRTTGKEHDG
jgi:hypothetical protein